MTRDEWRDAHRAARLGQGQWVAYDATCWRYLPPSDPRLLSAVRQQAEAETWRRAVLHNHRTGSGRITRVAPGAFGRALIKRALRRLRAPRQYPTLP